MKTYFCDICGRYFSRRECRDAGDEVFPFPTGPLCPRCDCFVRARGLAYVLAGLATAPLLGLLLWVILPSIATLPGIVVACGMSAVGLLKMGGEYRRRRKLAARTTGEARHSMADP